ASAAPFPETVGMVPTPLRPLPLSAAARGLPELGLGARKPSMESNTVARPERARLLRFFFWVAQNRKRRGCTLYEILAPFRAEIGAGIRGRGPRVGAIPPVEPAGAAAPSDDPARHAHGRQ